jgi:hypothetical protein
VIQLRGALVLAVLASLGCHYTRFRGAIPLPTDRTNLRVIGAFSPDGRQFATAEGMLSDRRETGNLKLWERGAVPDVPGRWVQTERLRLSDLFVVDLAFAPSGGLLAVAGVGRQGNILLWDARRGRAVGLLRSRAPLVQAIAFGPRGEWLAAAGLGGQIEVWDIRKGRVRATVAEESALLQQSRFPLAVASDGRWLAYGRTDGAVAFADPRTGVRLDVRPSGGKEIYDLAPSPDGRWLAVATDNGVSVWDLAGPPTDLPQRLARDRASALTFFPDGRTLLVCGRRPGHAKVLEVPSGRIVYGFITEAAHARNRPLAEAGSPLAVGPREEAISSRLREAFPAAGAEEAVRRVVLGYARFPTIHRVSVSPENLWVAFFEGGRASLVITERHYRMRLREGPPAPIPPRTGPTSGPGGSI